MASKLIEKRQPLDASQLRAIEVALSGKLRAHQLSEPFIERHAEELIQQALTEYARACEQGQEIDNPGGWIVNTAFRRAIDQLRREGREATPVAAEAALEIADGASAPPDEEAIRHIEAEQLHRAIRKLSVPQRQALSLYYFEERSTREGADALGWSEPTFRRRRDSALRALRERFGVIKPVPQQGDRTAIEVGLAAWLSLAGAQGHTGITDQLVAVFDSARGSFAALGDRVRDSVARLLSSGGGESIVSVASGPIAKTAGVCGAAVAAAVCVTGVVGPGVGGIDLLHGGSPKSPPAHEHARSHVRAKPTERRTPVPRSSSEPEAAPQPSQRDSSSGSGEEARARRATHAASSQFAPESAAEPAPSSSAPAPEPAPAPAPESTGSASPTQTANEQFGP